MTPTPAIANRPRARRLSAEVRREQIAEAALTVFARSSYRDSSTAAIAAEAGLSEAALFRHFPSKKALYLAALDRGTQVVLEHWQQIAASAPSPLFAIVEIGQWYFAELQRDSRSLQLRLRSCGENSDPEIQAHVQKHFLSVFEFVREVLEEARRRGEIDGETDVSAHTWLFLAIGILLDVTQMTGLREALPLEILPKLLMLTAPKPTLAGP